MIASRICRVAGLRVVRTTHVGIFQRSTQMRFASSTSAKDAMAEEVRRMQEALQDEELLAEPEQSMFEIVDGLWDTVMDTVSPFRWLEKLFYFLHENCGFEWWAAIFLTSSVLRILALPVQLHAARNNVRMQKYQGELTALKRSETVALSGSGISEKEKALIKNNHKIQLNALYKKGGFKEWKNFLTMASALPFAFVFYSTRCLMISEESVATGGTLWFKNLAEADPYCILPVISVTFMIMGAEMTTAQSVPQKAKYYALQLWGTRSAILFMGYMFSGTHAGVLLGLVTAAVMQCVQPLLLRNQKFREWYNVPSLERPPSSNIVCNNTFFISGKVGNIYACSPFKWK